MKKKFSTFFRKLSTWGWAIICVKTLKQKQSHSRIGSCLANRLYKLEITGSNLEQAKQRVQFGRIVVKLVF